MTDTPAPSKFPKKKIFFALSATSVTIAAVIAAVGILSGGDTWKAVATAGLIFALNILVLISFTAAHSWLKGAQRAVSVIAVFGTLFYTWVDVPYYWEYRDKPLPFLVWLREWSTATWILVAFFSALCLLSLCWKYIRTSAGLKWVYIVAMGLGVASAVVLWISNGSPNYSYSNGYAQENTGLTLLGSALSVLGAAASLIVIIGAFVEKNRRKAERPILPVPFPQEQQSSPSNTGSEGLRAELRAMAESGELAQLILSSPATVNELRSAILSSPDAPSEHAEEI